MPSCPSAEQYRLLVEHSPVMVWRSGVDGKCDYFNETWLRFTGRSLEQEVGDGWVEGVHQDDLERCLACYVEHLKERQPFEMEYRLRHHDGSHRYIFDRGVPHLDREGRFAGFIGSCVDVHERVVARQAKITFLSMMAHEQRTPLSAMKMFIASMQRRARRSQPLTEDMFARLNAQVDRFSRLVDVLSETARLEEGRAPSLKWTVLDLGELVRNVVGFRAESIESGAEVDRQHRLVVQDLGRPCWVRGDVLRLEQVFINLLDNAIKYSPRGGQVELRILSTGSAHRIEVSDPGIGIPRAELESVARRYFRASNASPEHFPGLGLGLSMCRDIVQRHGGSLAIQSELGRGTTVTVTLPAISSSGFDHEAHSHRG